MTNMYTMHVKTRKGRKKKPRLVRGLMGYLVLACVLFGSAFMFVAQRNSVTQMGFRLNDLKDRIAELDEEHSRLVIHFEFLKQPREMRKLISKHGLNLVPVEKTQIVEIPLPDPIEIPDNGGAEKDGTDRVERDRRLARKQ
jgi:hypothetical protein